MVTRLSTASVPEQMSYWLEFPRKHPRLQALDTLAPTPDHEERGRSPGEGP